MALEGAHAEKNFSLVIVIDTKGACTNLHWKILKNSSENRTYPNIPQNAPSRGRHAVKTNSSFWYKKQIGKQYLCVCDHKVNTKCLPIVLKNINSFLRIKQKYKEKKSVPFSTEVGDIKTAHFDPSSPI